MFKYVIQLILGFLTLLMSTAISWYEGSEIIDDSLEWKYSTPFSQLFNIEINTGRDISQLDYFVYAAKFQPFFPTIMTVSVIYIFAVLIFFIFQLYRQLAIILSGIISCVGIVSSGIFLNSTTSGGDIFFWITAVGALIFICNTISLWYKKKIQCLRASTST
ncbi:YjdJ family protein [Lysinibacillus sp. NPDC056959]|uniref:YjdJ family protein n=1 Tax=Lysinibacillus sp. NPDC056959 TaxID=3345981 RepID=UPI0036369FC0